MFQKTYQGWNTGRVGIAYYMVDCVTFWQDPQKRNTQKSTCACLREDTKVTSQEHSRLFHLFLDFGEKILHTKQETSPLCLIVT